MFGARFNSAPPVPDMISGPSPMLSGGFPGAGPMAHQDGPQQWPPGAAWQQQAMQSMQPMGPPGSSMGPPMHQMSGMLQPVPAMQPPQAMAQMGAAMQADFAADMGFGQMQQQMLGGPNMMGGPMQQPGMVPSTMAPHDDREMSRTTVFVGGLPSAGPDGEPHVDEAAIHNYFFSRCGPIKAIRMQAARNCCFVEFENEGSAREAVTLNGIPAALVPQHPAGTVRLMVRPAFDRPKRPLHTPHAPEGYAGPDVAAWDPAGSGPYDNAPAGHWHAGQAGFRQPDRHREASWGGGRRNAGRPRSPSPPAAPRYSDNENKKLKELLKQSIEEIEALPAGATVQLHGAPGPGGNLLHAMNTVRVWLQSGECGKKTADNFYVYLQSIHNKLLELKRAEEVRAEQRHAEDVAFWTQLSTQYDAALKTFNEAKKQKVKDNFSKVQRKNVERWVVTAVEGTKKISALLGVSAPDGEDMEVEEQKARQPASADLEADSPPPAGAKQAPPPPPPSAAGAATKPPPPPASATAGVPDAKRPKLEAPDNKESALASRISALERLLVEKLEGGAMGGATSASVLAAGSQKYTADAGTLCVLSALSVHLASYPQGATLPQLCSYVKSVSGADGGDAHSKEQDSKVEQLVQAALNLAPGVFTQIHRDGSEPMWSLTAMQALPSLLL